MWTTLVCVAALSVAPGQGGLTLKNDYLTFGQMGPPRPDNKVVPGDMLFVAFEIEGMKIDKIGTVRYSMTMEVKNAKGEQLYKRESGNLEALNSLGSGRLQASAHVFLGADQPPGKYTLSVTVTDRAAGTKDKPVSKTLVKEYEVQKVEFSIVRLQLSLINSDTPERFAAPAVGVIGQRLFVNFAVVGFARDDKTKNAKLTVSMRILDDQGKPTLPDAYWGEAGKELPENLKVVPMQFHLSMNRPGKFTVELQATDEIAKKKTTFKFPIVVMENIQPGAK